jgi:hypothetical protein
MEEKRVKDYVVQKSKNCVPIHVTSCRHKRGMKIAKKNNVIIVNQTTWNVKSDTCPGKEHKVTKKANDCFMTHCYISCQEAPCDGLCYHLYKCTCEDTDPLCKHIHAVHALMKSILALKVSYSSVFTYCSKFKFIGSTNYQTWYNSAGFAYPHNCSEDWICVSGSVWDCFPSHSQYFDSSV